MKIRFDGTQYDARAGETLAATLVRAGVLGGFASIYRGRPRGVFTADEQEPNALVQIGAEPMLRATLVMVEDGLEALPLRGKGRLIVPTDSRRHDHVHAHCDLLVVGGGRSGIAAASATRGRTILVESGPSCALRGDGDLHVLLRTTAVGLYDANYVLAVENRRRAWHIRAREIVLATGALERPLVFPDNDRPGVMLATAADHYDLDGLRVARADGAIAGTWGEDRLEGVIHADGRREACDVLAVSGGWSPRVHLWSQAGGRLRWDDRIGAPVPDGQLHGIECAGRLTGEGIPDAPPFALAGGDEACSFVDLERDSTVADLRRAIDAGLRSVEHVKRYTTIGTGSDQGKTANVNAVRLAAELLGVHPGELGTTTFRPPYAPVSFALLAGRSRGTLFDPVRETPIHPWHIAHGAVFENVGQWKRPRYYPRPGEDMDAAVLRECAAAREGVAIMDASTLGKIDVQGPDSVEFLNRLYTNAYDSLAIGMCRYGVMCRTDGMVFDDGVVMRIGEERFLCTTTTGNAGAVLAWMEEWLQTEWPELRVWLTSVTEQWATVAVVGPDSRRLLGELTAIALDAESFPFMAIREGDIADIPARLCRISFSGELAFEVNVDGRRGLELWRILAAAGQPTPYGTETMHVLRAEKGYPIIGQDTDGTVTPQDLGLDWIISKQKADFLGKRSLARSDATRADRRQLVALLPLDHHAVLPEGTQLVADPDMARPVPMLGYVTSSYRSATLGRTFALALVEGGRDRIGEVVYAPLASPPIAAEIAPSCVYDPEGTRRDGHPL
jgi:sarcosine oxidase, subunit alpha